MKANIKSDLTQEKICKECGSNFLVYKSTLKTRLYTYCSKECYGKNKTLLKGKKNPWWKGEDVGYSGLHSWIRRWLTKKDKCDHCGTTTAKKYEWANKDHNYKRDIKEYMYLCTSCHRKYDLENIYKKYKKICLLCLKEYLCSVHNKDVAKFCSDRCKSKNNKNKTMGRAYA